MRDLNELELKECNGGGMVVSRTPYNDDAIEVYREIFDAIGSYVGGFFSGLFS